MKDMNNNWTKELKDKMDSHEEPVPETLWAEICLREGISPSDKGKKVILPYFRYASIAAAAAIISVSGVMLIRHFPEKNGQDPDAIAIVETTVTENAESTGSTYLADGDTRTEPAYEMSIDEPGNAVYTVYNTKEPAIAEHENAWTDSQECTPHVRENVSPDKTQAPNVTQMPEDQECDLTLVPDYNDLPEEKIETQRFSFSASVSGTPGSKSSMSGYGNTLQASSETIPSSFGTDPAADIRMFNRTREVNTDTKYLQPVKAGISFRWYFARHWSIGTGAVWSWLHSRTTSGSGEYYCKTVQNLHYIGIPINISYDFWQGRKMRAYLSAEAMAEKCIAGKSSSEYIYNGAAGPHESRRLGEKQLQWSAGAKAGFQYDFTKNVGLYAEPEVTWHFDNGSAIENVYKDRPVNFSIGIGLRFSF